MPRLRVGSIAAMTLALLMGVACSAEDAAFQEAQDKNTIEAFEKFKTDFPENSVSVVVDERLDQLYFEKAQRTKAEADYKAYLDNFPKGKHAPTVKAEYEKFAYKAAAKADSAEGWEAFLKDFSSGNYAYKAKQRLIEASYRGKVQLTWVKVKHVNVEGERRGEINGQEMTVKVGNTGDKALASLKVDITPKGDKVFREDISLGEEGLAPGAEGEVTFTSGKRPEWTDGDADIEVVKVAFKE